MHKKKVLGRDGINFLSVYDFMIGQDVQIYGKNIRVNDCDEYTLEFFKQLGVPQSTA